MLALSWLYVQLTYRPYSNRTFENQPGLKFRNSIFFRWIRATAVMEAYFPRKALAIFVPGGIVCGTKSITLEVKRLQELCRLSEHLSVCQRLLSVLVSARTRPGQHNNASAGDFKSDLFHRNTSWCTKQAHFAMTLPVSFC